jgi:hypothetical protein
MKRLVRILTLFCVFIFLFILAAVPALAGTKTLTFGWQQNATDLPQMQDWKLYKADAAGGPYTLFATIPYNGTPAQEYTSTNPLTSPDGQEKTYYFVVRATDKQGNSSGYSNEVAALIDFLSPSVPVTLRVTVTNQP